MLGEGMIKKVLDNILQVNKTEIKDIKKMFKCLDEALEAKEKLEYEEDEKDPSFGIKTGISYWFLSFICFLEFFLI